MTKKGGDRDRNKALVEALKCLLKAAKSVKTKLPSTKRKRFEAAVLHADAILNHKSGQPSKIDPAEIKRRRKTESVAEIAKDLGVSRATIYNRLKAE